MAKQKYVVQRAGISLGHGHKVREGEVVELEAKQARHFTKHGVLAPYIPDDEDDEDGDDDIEPKGNSEGDILGRTTARRARQSNPDEAAVKGADPSPKQL